MKILLKTNNVCSRPVKHLFRGISGVKVSNENEIRNLDSSNLIKNIYGDLVWEAN